MTAEAGSKYFTLAQLTRSQYAARHGIDMTPPLDVRAELFQLMVRVLDPIREAWGRPIIVDSGYRPKVVNDAVGGSPVSDHLTGRAADLVPTQGTAEDLMLCVHRIAADLPLHQCILEFGWVHVSILPADQRVTEREFLRAERVANEAGQTAGVFYHPWSPA